MRSGGEDIYNPLYYTTNRGDCQEKNEERREVSNETNVTEMLPFFFFFVNKMTSKKV